MTVPSGIDSAAPVLAHHEVEIEATLDDVWRLHTDVNAWTTWQMDLTSARMEGPFEVGESFTSTSYGLEVTSTIYAFTLPLTDSLGGDGCRDHRYPRVALRRHPVQFMTTNESFAGQPVEADAANMQSLLDASLVSWLDHMKNAAESVA